MLLTIIHNRFSQESTTKFHATTFLKIISNVALLHNLVHRTTIKTEAPTTKKLL
jgi:hypothetical protein